MKRYWLRSTIFNFAFYIVNTLTCILFLPFITFPANRLMVLVRAYLRVIRFTEEHIMGLKLELRGLEHVPKEGSYIIAGKHQSAYETFKLHLIFDHPAIILKQELLKIPLWGKYLAASDVIAIDRSSPDSAIESIKEGAKRVKEQGRPIFIFPQGTRVPLDITAEEKPYKIGVARIYEATEDLPVIPMAINAGYFWPKTGWLKRPGIVIFEFLPPIEPGLDKSELMRRLENGIETKSQALLEEAQNAEKNKSSNLILKSVMSVFLLCAFVYTAFWFWTAGKIKERFSFVLQNSAYISRTAQEPKIWGFPGPIRVSAEKEIFETTLGAIEIQNLSAQSWPFPHTPVHIETGPITLTAPGWKQSLSFDDFTAKLVPSLHQITIEQANLNKGEFALSLLGTVANQNTNLPDMNLQMTAINHNAFITQLVEENIISQHAASFVSNGINLFKGDAEHVTLPLKIQNRVAYSGPIRLGEIPDFKMMKLPVPTTPSRKPVKRQKPIFPEDIPAIPSAPYGPELPPPAPVTKPALTPMPDEETPPMSKPLDFMPIIDSLDIQPPDESTLNP